MEQKRLDKRNLLVLGGVILLIAAVAVIAALQKRTVTPTLGELAADPTTAPAAAETAHPESTGLPQATAEMTVSPADAYLLVTVAGAMYEPIPLYEEARYTITRGEMVNVIEVTADTVRMYESSCENQDCVEQGLVSMENRSTRVLQNMIICLPNEVVLELCTRDEVVQMMLTLAGYTGEEKDE